MSESESPSKYSEPVRSSENSSDSRELSKAPEPSPPNGNAPENTSHPPCKICGAVATARHYGNACDACRHLHAQFKCINQDDKCDINEQTRSKSQHCRLEKCKRVGLVLYGPGRMPINTIVLKPCLVCGEECGKLHLEGKVCKPCVEFCRLFSERKTKYTECVAGNGRCEITVETRSKCKLCRFEKCKRIGVVFEAKTVRLQEPETTPRICKVCERESVKLYNNKTACKLCQEFFRRAHKNKRRYICTNDQKCEIGQKNDCLYCRLQKCLALGMRIAIDEHLTDRSPTKIEEKKKQLPTTVEQQKCKVCSCSLVRGNGMCNACNQIYYKYVNNQSKLSCVFVPSGKCEINMKTRKTCVYCRFQKFVKVRAGEEEEPKKVILTKRKNVEEVEKVRLFRSKSADCPKRIIEKPSFDFSFSMTDLSEIEDYAIGKVTIAKEQCWPNIDVEDVILREFSKFLDISKLFTNRSSLNTEYELALLHFMICSGKTNLLDFEQKRAKLGILQEKYTLLFADENGDEMNPKIKEHRGLEEYQKYLEIVKEFLEKARNMVDERLTKINESLLNFNPLFLNLIDAYKAIFDFNLYLFEHLLHLIARYVFNPYFIFWSEKSENVVRELWKYLDDVLERIPIVMDAYFNVEPLKRQLEDLKILKGKNPEEELQYQVYTLARCAMRNIRVPQTADKFLNHFDWMNSFGRFNETFDLLRIPSRSFDSVYFFNFLDLIEQNGYQKENVREQCTQILHKSTIGTLLAGVLKNSEGFFKELLDGEGVDRRMKIFYQNQVIQKILDVVKSQSLPEKLSEVDRTMLNSAMISNYKYQYPCQKFGQFLNEKYLDFMKFPEVPLYISPSYVGVAFATFETDVFVSVVKNCNDKFIKNPENGIFKRGLIRNENEAKFNIKCGDKLDTIVVLNTDTGKLGIKMLYPQEKETTDDQVAFGVLDLIGRNNEEIATEIAGIPEESFNDLRKVLDTRMRATEYPKVIGRLENPKEFSLEEREDLNIF